MSEPGKPDAPTLSAIVPAFDARHYLERSLPALMSLVGSDLLEVIVVDDGSSDGSAEFAASFGARVLESGGRLGPGAARNVGARAAGGDILLFVDADVVIRPDAPARLRAALRRDGVVAAFGSYDDAPPEPNFMSQYMNLRHHLGHQQGAGEASTFWAGCGAVWREAFLAVDGFDTERYARPSIEDIELGYRLRAAGGRIELVAEAQATHLKRWGARELVETDVFKRAIPWSRLLLESPEAEASLNTSTSERFKAGVAGLCVGAGALWAVGAWPAWPALLALAAAAALSRRLVALFARRNGPVRALAALLFHQVYYLYSAAAYGWCWLELRGRTASRS